MTKRVILRRIVRAAVPMVLIAAALAAGFVIGQAARPPRMETAAGKKAAASAADQTPAAQASQTVYTCAMHPQIRSNKPGRCPICGMELIPVAATAGAGKRTFVTTPQAAALMDIETSPVERRSVAVEVRMVGKVTPDETRLGYITAWISGRLDRLYVDFTGVKVKKGDPMVYIYSPRLLAAQQELLQAIAAAKSLGKSAIPILRDTAEKTVESTREKLRLWGLANAQIAQIEKNARPSDHVTLAAPMSGTVPWTTARVKARISA